MLGELAGLFIWPREAIDLYHSLGLIVRNFCFVHELDNEYPPRYCEIFFQAKDDIAPGMVYPRVYMVFNGSEGESQSIKPLIQNAYQNGLSIYATLTFHRREHQHGAWKDGRTWLEITATKEDMIGLHCCRNPRGAAISDIYLRSIRRISNFIYLSVNQA